MNIPDIDVLGVPLWDKPKQEEPAHGLFLRLIEINGYDVSKALGFSLASLRRGENVGKLAALIRADEAELLENSFAFSAGEKVTIRGEQIGLRDLMAGARRVCHQCIESSPYHRFWWDIDFIDCCPHHEVMLTDRCSCEHGGRLSWSDSAVGNCLRCDDPGSENTVEKIEPPNSYMLQANRYFLGRLGVCGKEVSPVLDALPLDEAVDTTVKVGALFLKGYSLNWPQLSAAETQHCRALGHFILQNGILDKCLRGIFDSFMESAPDKDAFNPSRGRSFGWFYHWLNGKGGEKYSPSIASIFEKVAQETVDRISWDPPSRQNVEIEDFYMNLSEAALECRQGKTTMRRILRQFGKDRSLPRQGVPFRLEPAVISDLRSVLEERCNYAEVRGILGTGHLMVRRFIERGFFSPVVKGGCDRHEYAFRREDVEKFLELLGRDTPELDACPDDALPLQQAARTYAAPLDMLCMSILIGHSQLAGRLQGKSGLAQFAISRDATRTFRRWYVEEGESYLLQGMFQFQRMRQMKIDFDDNATQSAA